MKTFSLLLISICLLHVQVFPQCHIANAGSDQGGCSTGSYTIGTSGVSGYTYSWTPTTGLNNPNIAQPTASPSVTTTYTVTATPTSFTNLLTTPGFESGYQSGGYSYFSSDLPQYPSYVSNNIGTYLVTDYVCFGECGCFAGHTGSNMLYAQAPESNASNYRFYYKTISISTNTDYTFSGWMGSFNTYDPAKSFDIKMVGNSTGTSTVTKTIAKNCDWQPFSMTWNSNTNTSVTIELRFNFNGPYNSLVIDDLVFAACGPTSDQMTVYVGAPSITPTGPISECIQYEINEWLSLSTSLTDHIQWYENGNAISGATSSTLNLSNNPSGGTGFPTCSSTITVKNSLTNCTSSGVSVTRKNYSSPAAYVNTGGTYSTPSSYCASGGTIQQVPSINSGTTYWWEVYDENFDPATDIIISPMNTTSPSATISFGSYPYTTAYIVPRASDNGCNLYLMDYEISIDLGCRPGIVTNTDSGRKSLVKSSAKSPYKKSIPKATEIKASLPFIYIPEVKAKQEPEIKIEAGEQAKLFPNPANTQIAVTSKNLIRHIQVSNLSGVVLRNFKVNGLSMAVINIQDLPAGIYNCRVITGNGTEYLKLVVQR